MTKPSRSSSDSTLFQDNLGLLIAAYKKKRKPITVNFREMVPDLRYNAERFTHQIHPYPAKLLVHIPYYFLRAGLTDTVNPVVLDPFCGSGTVALETLIAGGRPIAADSNPLARLISEVKLKSLPSKHLQSWKIRLTKNWDTLTSKNVDVINREKWFSERITTDLGKIKTQIDRTINRDIKSFCRITLSSIVKSLSFADPRVSVPVQINPNRYPKDHWLATKAIEHLKKLEQVDILEIFLKAFEANGRKIQTLNNLKPQSFQIFDEARVLKDKITRKKLPAKSVDLVVTSPPYLGAQKYIRSSSLSLGWLDLCKSTCLRDLEDLNIGREHFRKSDYKSPSDSTILTAYDKISDIHDKNNLRSTITITYLEEMKNAFQEVHRVLKPGGHLVLVSSNNTVCGVEFTTKDYLRQILEEEFGMTCRVELIDHIKSRGLMTKRNKTASTIAFESVFIFRREN